MDGQGNSKGGMSVDQALAVLRDAATSKRAKDALGVLESEIKTDSQEPGENKSSSGQRAAKPSFPSSNDFAARMAAMKSKSGARSGATA